MHRTSTDAMSVYCKMTQENLPIGRKSQGDTRGPIPRQRDVTSGMSLFPRCKTWHVMPVLGSGPIPNPLRHGPGDTTVGVSNDAAIDAATEVR